MNIPLVSIIVPCYNQAQYLDEALQSVFEQIYMNWECIIVNDGSPDHTEEVTNKWVSKDSRFVYLKKENGGLSSARNAGIKIAKGAYILPLDADDRIASEYLDKAQIYFDKDYKIIYCQAYFFGNRVEPWLLSDYSYEDILFNNQIFCSAFFKKSDWESVDGYDENLKYGREDWDFWLSILNKDCRVLRLDYVGFFYRQKDISMDVEINSNLELLQETENYIYKKHLKKYLFYSSNAIVNTQYFLRNEKERNKMKLFFKKNKIMIKILSKLRIVR
ncbi:glycosyltransferase family 2 protein [Flavobacterium sp. W20_MBD1_R3]|uniref:glycosyltransferase family 2 protein n=1 Tax=Flavobacterium sp. W20_MBD1_R3 TaxID=3240278 RepID=UPI003F8F0781